jgi:hypothetical protein
VIESRLAAPRATIRAGVRAAAARASHSNPAAPALLDPKRHALTVGVGDLQVRDLEHPEARAVGDAERRQGEIPAKGAQARAGDTRAGCPHIRMWRQPLATVTKLPTCATRVAEEVALGGWASAVVGTTNGVDAVRPQESGFEESVQRRKRFVWILFGKKMTTRNRLEFHVSGLVLPGHRNVEERRRRW